MANCIGKLINDYHRLGRTNRKYSLKKAEECKRENDHEKREQENGALASHDQSKMV
jgi:hypothetical protein